MRDALLATSLLAVGVLSLLVAVELVGPSSSPSRGSSGDLGEVTVFAQTVEGPVPLTSGRAAVLPRPQAFAFQLSVAGTGPRSVRVDLDDGDDTVTLHQEIVWAPASSYALDYVARLGDLAADELALLVTVEAPHLGSRARRYPIILATASHRFWDPER